jgi:hypothetical protein
MERQLSLCMGDHFGRPDGLDSLRRYHASKKQWGTATVREGCSYGIRFELDDGEERLMTLQHFLGSVELLSHGDKDCPPDPR